jgi:hypothetical protein
MADAAVPTPVKDQATSISPSLAQTLPNDAVLDALKLILLGAPLNEVLTTITRLIEAPAVWCRRKLARSVPGSDRWIVHWS